MIYSLGAYLVTLETEVDHLQTLVVVLKWMAECGLRAKKCTNSLKVNLFFRLSPLYKLIKKDVDDSGWMSNILDTIQS